MWKRRFTLLVLSLCAVNVAVAEESAYSLARVVPVSTEQVSADDSIPAGITPKRLNIDPYYALGVNRFDIDGHSEVIGWKVASSVYFGHQGGRSGLSLVWQKDGNEVSLSKRGLRLSHHF